METTEIRMYSSEISLRQDNNEENKIDYIEGYGFKYNVLSKPIWGMFRERILPGSLEGADISDIKSYFNHDVNLILGRSSSGTLLYRSDNTGLFYSVIAPKTSYAADLLVSLERKDVKHSSFAFTVAEENWTEDEEGEIREIVRFKLIDDLSPVSNPAYLDTTSYKRSIEELNKKYPDKKIVERLNNIYDYRKRKNQILKFNN